MTETPESPATASPASEPPANDVPESAGVDTMTGIRDALVEAALIHVAFDGWSPRCLRAAAVDAGFEAAQADRAFPGGSADAVAHWCDLADRRMEEALMHTGMEGLRLHERVARAIRLRLQHWDMDREAVRRAVAVLSLPTNTRLALRCAYRTVDTIWWAVGDTSTDLNFYTKRVQLAGVYSATLLYWLDDSSEGAEETWAFLNRRLEGIVRLHRARSRVKAAAGKVPNPFRAARSVGEGVRSMARHAPFGRSRAGGA